MYTYVAKAIWLQRYETALADPCVLHPQVYLLEKYNLNVGFQSNISKWYKNSETIYTMAALNKVRHLKCPPAQKERKPKWPLMEKDVLAAYKERRRIGLKVSRRFLRITAIKSMQLHYPEVDFVGSRCWTYRFTRRNNISWRRKSNLKQKSLWEKLPDIQRFHKELLHLLKSLITDEVYGRYPLSHRHNVDQVPCAFLLGSAYTYADQGSKRVWVKGPKGASGLAKRQCTLQICFSGEGNLKFFFQYLQLQILEKNMVVYFSYFVFC